MSETYGCQFIAALDNCETISPGNQVLLTVYNLLKIDILSIGKAS